MILKNRCSTTGTQRMRAFSLVEVVLAVGVFSFAVVSVVGLMGTATQILGTSRQIWTKELAVNRLFSASRAMPFTNLPSINNQFYYFDRFGNPVSSRTNAILTAEVRVSPATISTSTPSVDVTIAISNLSDPKATLRTVKIARYD